MFNYKPMRLKVEGGGGGVRLHPDISPCAYMRGIKVMQETRKETEKEQLSYFPSYKSTAKSFQPNSQNLHILPI